MARKQSFEEYFYRNIHAEGCGCSEKILENFEIDRRAGEFHQQPSNPFPVLWRALRRLFSRKRSS